MNPGGMRSVEGLTEIETREAVLTVAVVEVLTEP